MGCIYKITNKINNDFYLGSTWKLGIRRWSEHYSALRKKKHFNKHLQNAVNQYGIDNFEFSIHEELLFPIHYSRDYINEYLLNQEIYYVSLLNPHYNICKEISRGVLGRVKSKEEINKIVSKRNETIKNRGFLHDEYSKSLIKQARSKQVITQEHKDAISRKLKGVSTRGSGWKATREEKDKTLSTKKSLAEKRGYWHSSKCIENITKAKRIKAKHTFEVFRNEKLIYTFDNLSEAQETMKMDKKLIWAALNRNTTHLSLGYFFKYKEV